MVFFGEKMRQYGQQKIPEKSPKNFQFLFFRKKIKTRKKAKTVENAAFSEVDKKCKKGREWLPKFQLSPPKK